MSFLADGFRVINVSRRTTSNPNIIDVPCDLSQERQISECAAGLLNDIQQASSVCLVHNAGYLSGDSAIDVDMAALKRCLAINVIAPSLLNKHLACSLPPSSSIIYIGSTLSEKATAGCFSYITSKHAVAGMMKASTQDLFGRGIHSCCICPGFTETEMLQEHIPEDDVRLNVGANNGFGRLAEPAEIAQMIVWAHANPIINGSVLHGHLGQKEH